MLGSCKKCSNCHSEAFRRIKSNRAIQCVACKLILEERCLSDLTEYHAVSQTEENHCVVTPDFMHNHIVDDIPNDPYCTPGFITAFRMLSPIREPVYTATARTLSGSLAEMERAIGDALFTGYVGYNGRAPGLTTTTTTSASITATTQPPDHPTSNAPDPSQTERNKSGGDARHTLVAYFEIVELASILFVDRDTANLAIRIFRHTASNTSLRNRNVESLATAAFVAAVERRCWEYDQWVQTQKSLGGGGTSDNTTEAASTGMEDVGPSRGSEGGKEADKERSPWPIPPRPVTVDEVAMAANLEVGEIQRNLKVVNAALRKQRPEGSASIMAHMPTFCKQLELPERTQRLAMGLVEETVKRGICQRRNPMSVSAAALYLACQLDGVRKTQMEICRVIGLTEVTLRKVHNELNQEREAIIPEWFRREAHERAANGDQERKEDNGGRRATGDSTERRGGGGRSGSRTGSKADEGGDAGTAAALVPPPLPPGFIDRGAEVEVEEVKVKMKGKAKTKKKGKAKTKKGKEDGEQDGTKALLEMMNTPAVQAMASAFSMMPQMMPPPPPPLPPGVEGSGKEAENEVEKVEEVKEAEDTGDKTAGVMQVVRMMEAAQKQGAGTASNATLAMLAAAVMSQAARKADADDEGVRRSRENREAEGGRRR